MIDNEEKYSFELLGPNPRGRAGHISTIYRDDNRNYLYYGFVAFQNGEYIIKITNKGSKENELILLINENCDKKKDLIHTEKIYKITMLLNNIDNNMSQLRNKKKIERRQADSHNEKVNNNNKAIVIYSIFEIFVMIIIFATQSIYISSIVSKI